jgi:hypothetical protein
MKNKTYSESTKHYDYVAQYSPSIDIERKNKHLGGWELMEKGNEDSWGDTEGFFNNLKDVKEYCKKNKLRCFDVTYCEMI